MKKVLMSLVTGICVVTAGFNTSLAGNTLANNEIPASGTNNGTVAAITDINFKLIETNTNPFAQKKLVVEMRDMMGKYIYTSAAATTVDGQPAIDVDMPQLPKGVYIYTVFDDKDNLISTGKYIKE
jgi:hypothetical protein